MRWLPLWLLPSLVLANPFQAVWEFPRAYRPAPVSFVLSYTTPDGQTLAALETPPSAVGACLGPATGDTFCTVLPTCPPPGVMVFWVHAVWSATEVSDRSELVICLFTPEEPCVCQDPGTYRPDPGDVVNLPPLPPGEIAPITTITLPPLPAFAPRFPPPPT